MNINKTQRRKSPDIPETGERKETSVVRKKRTQSNHEEYIIPDCMLLWAHEPLYLVIARWCEMLGRWIKGFHRTIILNTRPNDPS
ncbi:CaiF/GrlA family transcriptional regulator [Salmonella enterica]|nr:CaiF/GrlA family transcriptional regulator [Salmonella enterica]EJC3639533.1 CaiF/GrlA family transcriptional regulator [Salmonella enterica]